LWTNNNNSSTESSIKEIRSVINIPFTGILKVIVYSFCFFLFLMRVQVYNNIICSLLHKRGPRGWYLCQYSNLMHKKHSFTWKCWYTKICKTIVIPTIELTYIIIFDSSSAKQILLSSPIWFQINDIMK